MRRRARLLRDFREARKYRSIPKQLIDLIIHKLKINTHWEDYYRFGFYRNDKSWAERALYLGEHNSKYWPWEGNSLKFDNLFIRKSLQKSIMIAHGLPTPPLLMTVGAHYPINSKNAFVAELAKISVPVILKIDGGYAGLGIYLFEPDSGKYRHKGELVTADWIWDRFENQLDPGFIVEEKVENHPQLINVHPASLNTLRITTVKLADGQFHLLQSFIKFGRGGSYVDNLKAGGLLVPIDKDHRMCAAINYEGDKFESHPDTGAQIAGLEIPFCEQAYQLALDASRTFGFMATIGWDIAITPDGPTIIEGNTHWGTDIFQDFVAPYLTDEIAAGLMPRHWWTPWDRTHINPGNLKNVRGGWVQKRMAKRRKTWLT